MTFLKLEDMPGDTPEVKALQLQQYEAADAMYDTLGRLNQENREVPGWTYRSAYEHADYKAAFARYEATVKALQDILGEDAHCAQVDSDLWSTYSDIFKDRNGFRPRMHNTVAQVKEWLSLDENPACPQD